MRGAEGRGGWMRRGIIVISVQIQHGVQTFKRQHLSTFKNTMVVAHWNKLSIRTSDLMEQWSIKTRDIIEQ